MRGRVRDDAQPARAPSAAAARLALAVALLLTLGSLALRFAYHESAGALWRDEVNSVNVASLPTLSEKLAHLRYDSFPPLWIATLSTWRAAGLAGDDAGYRRLGLAIGLLTVGVVWWTGLHLGVGPPLAMLLLIGLGPSMVVYGDSVRGYGLAAMAVLWSAGATWAFVERATWGRYAVAQVAAILAAQAHFGNGIPLLGIGLGGALVCWRRGDLRRLFATLAIGGVAALALLAANAPILRYMMQAGQQELHSSITLARIAGAFASSLTLDVPGLGPIWVLSALAAATGLGAALLAARGDARAPRDDVDRALFALVSAGITIGVTLPAYVRTSIPTQAWHYLSVIAMSALACEVGIWSLARRSRRGDAVRIAAIALAALLVFPALLDGVRVRMTSVDLAAREIERAARPDDLVVVFPWVAGITFDRYYRGPAPWITLPDLPDHRFHLHLLVRERMELGDRGVAGELARVEETLRRGGRVWVVGAPRTPGPGMPLPELPAPSARGSAGWHLDHWEMQLGLLLDGHVRDGRRVLLPEVGAVSAWENLPLYVVEGWR